jgi:translation initiation factor IF-3
MDYGEYTYIEKKKKNEAKKKQHRIEVKEVKFRPNTDQHDYNFKKNHAVRFLEQGNKVKAVVFFRGREITHSDLGRKILNNLAQDVKDLGEVEGRPRLEGRQMHVIIGPKKKKEPAQRPSPPSSEKAPESPPPAAQAQ